MSKRRPQVADVFRSCGTQYLNDHGSSTTKDQRRVLNDLVACRTAALGSHIMQCDRCGHQQVSYCSCRNRHCPKCQGAARAAWLDARAADLLDVQYFHVVFTLPNKLGPIALQNKREVYAILFRAVSETLHAVARRPKHLGAEIGFLAILHTWGQTIHHHPHIHCVIPGGGLSPDGTRWISCRKGFFLPVRVLSRLFRSKFLYYLKNAYESRLLGFHGKLAHLGQKGEWKKFVRSLYKTDWVVYSKNPFGGPHQVLKYLARYTHRVAISNARLVSFEDGQVAFRWKDYASQSRERTMTLDAHEFIRRFLLHVLPSGFMRIRHYGFLANRCRRDKLALCKQLLRKPLDSDVQADSTSEGGDDHERQSFQAQTCPVCKKGHMVLVDTKRIQAVELFSFEFYDTS